MLRLIEVREVLGSAAAAEDVLGQLQGLPGFQRGRVSLDAQGYQVRAYFPLGEVDPRAELPAGCKVVVVPAALRSFYLAAEAPAEKGLVKREPRR